MSTSHPRRRRVAVYSQISTIEQADAPGRAELARAWARSHGPAVGPQRENGKRGRGAPVTAETYAVVTARLAGRAPSEGRR